MVQLDKCMVSNENLERRRQEQDVMMKMMTSSVKHLKAKMSLLDNEKKMVEKTTDKDTERGGVQKEMVGRNAEKLLKGVAASFV